MVVDETESFPDPIPIGDAEAAERTFYCDQIRRSGRDGFIIKSAQHFMGK